MTISVKNGGAYSAPVGIFSKKNSIYAAVQGVFAKKNGAYQSVYSSFTPAPFVSMSIRARAPTGISQIAAGVNPFTNFRQTDRANSPGNGMRGNFWNGWCNTNIVGRMQDIANISPASLGIAYITGVDGTSNMDQSAGTLYVATWNNAANGVPGFVMRLDKTVPTAAQFLADGGSLGSSGTRIIIPPGYKVEHDPVTTPSNVSGQFAVQLEVGGASSCVMAVTNAGAYTAGTPIAVTTTTGVPVVGWKYLTTGTGVPAVPTSGNNWGDESFGTVATYSTGFVTLNQDFTATAGQAINLGARYPTSGIISNASIGDGTTQGTLNKCLGSKNWTAGGGVSGVTSASGSSYASLNDVWATNVNGVENLGVMGDSTEQGNHDANPSPNQWWGDAYSAEGWVSRAFNTAGKSFVRGAVSGSSPVPEVLYPSVIRMDKMKYVSRTVDANGHNCRGLPWLGVAGTGYQETLRSWRKQVRANMWGGDGKMASASLLPQCTGTYTTAAGQTVVAGTIDPAGAQMQYRAFLLAGSFSHAAGDPDLALDLNNWIYLDAVANGGDLTGVTQANGKWPAHTDWVASGSFGSTLEGTHKQVKYHASCAVRLGSALPAFVAL